MTVAKRLPCCLAVDIGGTKIASGVFAENGQALGEVTHTPVPFGPDGQADPQGLVAIIQSRLEAARESGWEPLGLGLSVCGNVDRSTGNCLLVPNLHWQDVPFGDLVRAATGLPTFAATDVRQAALAEHIWGAARGVGCFCWCTVGTGYGGYLYLEGKPYDGVHGIAGPFGHNTLDEVSGYPCGCGRRGCVETYVAGPAIARAGQAAVEAGQSPLLAQLSAGGQVTTAMVIQAYRRSDPAATGILQEVVRKIAISLAGVNNLLDLDRFILGGGVVQALPELVRLLDDTIRAYLMSPEARRDLKICPESFANSSLVGAAAHAFVSLGLLADGP
jgi:glucokinase